MSDCYSTHRKKKMKFSFIVPVYNVEMYLEECINSIIEKSEIEKEVILVDDGSTDNSGNICNQYSIENDCVKVIHKSNGGLSDARNVGLSVASGDYIAFVDSDDYIKINCMYEVEKLIEIYDNPDVVFMKRISFIETKGAKIFNDEGLTSEINMLRGDDLYIYFASLKKYPASACIKVIRRSFLLDNNLFFEKGILSEDIEWGMRLFPKITRAVFCPADYYYYRTKRMGSISNSVSEKNVMDNFRNFKKGVTLAKKSDNNAQRIMIMSFTEYLLRILVLYYNHLSDQNKKIIRKELKKDGWILNHRKDKKSKMIYYVYSLLGINGANILLRIYLKGRKV